jgi:hypothetical protein
MRLSGHPSTLLLLSYLPLIYNFSLLNAMAGPQPLEMRCFPSRTVDAIIDYEDKLVTNVILLD